MPIFEYKCIECDCKFEFLKLSDQDVEPRCPSCCSGKIQRLISAGAVRPEGIPTGKGGFKGPACGRSKGG